MKNTGQICIIFLLGLVAGLMLVNLIKLSEPTSIYANNSGPGSAGNLTAVTGSVGSNIDALWVINSEIGKTGPSLCLYVPESSGRGFHLAGARRIKYDIQIMEVRDETARSLGAQYAVDKLGDAIKKMEEKDNKEKK